MKLKCLLSYIVLITLPLILKAQGNQKYITRDGSELTYTAEELALKLPANLKPLMDYPLRDPSICLGPDSIYYLTGTTGGVDWWNVTSNIQVWKSKDLKNWAPVSSSPRGHTIVWNADRDGGDWQKKGTIRNGAFFRPIWAPEIHYFKNTFWLTYCIPGCGNGILKSTSGKAEGPYVSALNPDVPLNKEIDGSLFIDDDGKVYSVAGNGKITPLKDDMSGPAGPAVVAVPANAKQVGFEGPYLFKANGKYYMSAAEFVNGDYHCFVASADKIYGPYGNRYLAVPHGGHNVFFQDINKNWWSTFFGNDKHSPFTEKAGILRMEFDEHGHIKPVTN